MLRAVVLARAVSVQKHFGAVRAVDGVTTEFRAGEIHAVCGENGAGKSTLLKLVAGLHPPDAGTIIVGDGPLTPHTAREAIARGVAMVLQHFALVPVFTALENIMLGAEPVTGPARLGVLDVNAARSRAKAVAADLGVDLALDTRVSELGIGDRQRIEIARALFRDARLVILDEPTAVLTKTEATALYATVRRLAEGGKGIVVVTHKMDEVRDHADVVTVMRRGAQVFTRPIDRSAPLAPQIDAVTQAIMSGDAIARGAGAARPPTTGSASGEATDQADRSPPAAASAPALVMKGVSVGRALEGVRLEVRPGEIVGIAGVEGNGQHELVAVLAGDFAPDSGVIEGGPVAVVREDRQEEGLVLSASLEDNLVLGELGRFTRWAGILDLGALEATARERLQSSGAPPDLARAASTLSGGNQQKIVVARALARQTPVLVLAQPTRGVDLAASEDIHAKIRSAAGRGAAVVVVSADLDELRKLGSRVLVLARGKIVADLPAAEASDDRLGRLMLGLEASA